MKDRHRASRGQALAQLSNHYLSSPLFSPPFLWQVICQQAAGSGLSIRAVAPEYFSVHTHIHTLFHASPGPDTLLPLVRRMRVRVGGGGSMPPAPCIICHTAALSLMSLSGFSSSFFSPPHSSSLVQLTVSIFSRHSSAWRKAFLVSLTAASDFHFV